MAMISHTAEVSALVEQAATAKHSVPVFVIEKRRELLYGRRVDQAVRRMVKHRQTDGKVTCELCFEY
jgi:hypothetical protein